MAFHANAKFVGRKSHPLQCSVLSFESLAAMLPVAASNSNTKTSSRCSSECRYIDIYIYNYIFGSQATCGDAIAVSKVLFFVVWTGFVKKSGVVDFG